MNRTEFMNHLKPSLRSVLWSSRSLDLSRSSNSFENYFGLVRCCRFCRSPQHVDPAPTPNQSIFLPSDAHYPHQIPPLQTPNFLALHKLPTRHRRKVVFPNMIPWVFRPETPCIEGRGEDGRDDDGDFSITLSRCNPTASLKLVRLAFQSPLPITNGGHLEDDGARARTWVSSPS